MINNWDIKKFAKLESTNDEALKESKKYTNNMIIVAAEQTAGRGRRGRYWVSLKGNLFFSMLLEFDIRQLGALVAISGLSLLQAIKSIAPHFDVKLKWPNDVLVEGAKISGILLEKGENNCMVVGIGVNIKKCPQNTNAMYAVTSLKDLGINITSDDFLEIYLQQFDINFSHYNDEGIDHIRNLWLQNTCEIGTKIKICQDGKWVTGTFRGIDENVNLLLVTEDGIKKITVGDVFYIE